MSADPSWKCRSLPTGPRTLQFERLPRRFWSSSHFSGFWFALLRYLVRTSQGAKHPMRLGERGIAVHAAGNLAAWWHADAREIWLSCRTLWMAGMSDSGYKRRFQLCPRYDRSSPSTDIRAPKSAFGLNSSALPPKGDILRLTLDFRRPNSDIQVRFSEPVGRAERLPLHWIRRRGQSRRLRLYANRDRQAERR